MQLTLNECSVRRIFRGLVDGSCARWFSKGTINTREKQAADSVVNESEYPAFNSCGRALAKKTEAVTIPASNTLS
jgi:hypothetical protein